MLVMLIKKLIMLNKNWVIFEARKTDQFELYDFGVQMTLNEIFENFKFFMRMTLFHCPTFHQHQFKFIQYLNSIII